MAAPVSVALLDHFAALPDPRQRAKVLYPLPEILLLVLAATLAGARPREPSRSRRDPRDLRGLRPSPHDHPPTPNLR
jgi:DDE_Tnp_1-associated